MKKNKINKLEDKDLQLRYYLGGLQSISNREDYLCNYWGCDINCSCSMVSDDERLSKVKEFIDKHSITNERFIRLSYAFLTGYIMKYRGINSPLFEELAGILDPYCFKHTKIGEIPDNDFRERELESITSTPIVIAYLNKYKLDVADFISLAKTSLNFRLPTLYVENNQNDTFISELCSIIDKHNLYVSREIIEEYREEFKTKRENTQLVIDTKATQKKYLELMKKLLIKDSNLATEMISDELGELGFNTRKDVKKLVRNRKPNQKG